MTPAAPGERQDNAKALAVQLPGWEFAKVVGLLLA
jgi:hypothetical protein